jgi:hypothetical protein
MLDVGVDMAEMTFREDPMMQQFLMDLDAYQRGRLLGDDVKQPMPSGYSGGDSKSEKLMRQLLERIMNQQFAQPPAPANGDPKPNYGAGTVGERWG